MSEVIKPKINLNEIISVSLNIDNFKKYLEYLEELNKKQIDEMKDLKIKLSRLENFETIADEISSKIQNFEFKIQDVSNTTQWHSTKFLEFELKSNAINEKFTHLEKYDRGYDESKIRMRAFEEKIENFARISESSHQDIIDCNEKITKLNGEFPLYVTIETLIKTKENLKKEFESEIEIFKNETMAKIYDFLKLRNKEENNDLVDRIFSNSQQENNNNDENEINQEVNFNKNISHLHLNQTNSENQILNQSEINNLEVKNKNNSLHTNVSIKNNRTEVIMEELSNQIERENNNEIILRENLESKVEDDKFTLNIKTNDSVSTSSLNVDTRNVGTPKNEIPHTKSIFSQIEKTKINSSPSRDRNLKLNTNGNLNAIKESPTHVKRSSSLALRKEIELLKKDLRDFRNAQEFSLIDLKSEFKAMLLRTKRESITANLNTNDANLSSTILIIEETSEDRNVNLSKINNNNNHNNNNVSTSPYLNRSRKSIKPALNFGNCVSSINDKEFLIKDQLLTNVVISAKASEDKIKQIEEMLNKRSREITQQKVLNIEISHTTESKTKPNEIKHNNEMLANIQDLITQDGMQKDDIRSIYDTISHLKAQVNHFKSIEEEQENHSDTVNKRLIEVERNVNRIRCMIDDTTKGVDEGDGKSDRIISSPSASASSPNVRETSIKDTIKTNTANLKLVTDRVDKIQNKLDHILNEIVNKLKKDLTVESHKILEEFKVDLKFAIIKLDDQIKGKVDKYNFEDFGRKIDGKISKEISNKIDKNELKKNNSQLNKKIDNLENKISKTLVDTIIDLQMDDAPLIITKGMQGDKCVSCNQAIDGSPVHSNYMKYNEFADRYKLKNIQEITNKLGMGSFSRILNNCQPETIIDDLCSSPAVGNRNKKNPHIINEFTSVNLPEISTNCRSSSEKAKELNILAKGNCDPYTKTGTNGNTLATDKKLNNVVNGELEKKNLTGENLLKSVDKLHGLLDKK